LAIPLKCSFINTDDLDDVYKSFSSGTKYFKRVPVLKKDNGGSGGNLSVKPSACSSLVRELVPQA
jgi:hypothetical protein